MGVALHEGVVLEGGRFALVAVDDQVDGLRLAQHPPLAAGVEARPAPAQDARGREWPGGRPRGSWSGPCAGPRNLRWPGRRRGPSSAPGRSGPVTIGPSLAAGVCWRAGTSSGRRFAGSRCSGRGVPPGSRVLATAAVVRVVASCTGWPCVRRGAAPAGPCGAGCRLANLPARAAGARGPAVASAGVDGGPHGGQADGPPHPAQCAVGGDLVRQPARLGPQPAVPAPGCHVPEEAPVDGEAGGVAAQGQALGVFQGEHAVLGGARRRARPGAPRCAPAARRRRPACRRCWCTRPPRSGPRARGGTCRRSSLCPAPRPASARTARPRARSRRGSGSRPAPAGRAGPGSAPIACAGTRRSALALARGCPGSAGPRLSIFAEEPALGRIEPIAPGTAAQRSTSPSTGSMLDMQAITSGMKAAAGHGRQAWRLANEGARTWTRYGRDVPSETM